MKKIDRFMVWFRTEQGDIKELNNFFWGISLLFERLLNEKYEGKKIKFININLGTSQLYEEKTVIKLNHTHYYNGHLNYNGVFEKSKLESLSVEEQTAYVWNKIYEAMLECSKIINNEELKQAVIYAYTEGLKIDLNTDFKVIEIYFNFNEVIYSASVVFSFKEDGIYSKLSISNEGVVVHELNIDKTVLGNEYFLTIYKSINIQDNILILKGRSEIKYLPLKIDLNDIFRNK